MASCDSRSTSSSAERSRHRTAWRAAGDGAAPCSKEGSAATSSSRRKKRCTKLGTHAPSAAGAAGAVSLVAVAFRFFPAAAPLVSSPGGFPCPWLCSSCQWRCSWGCRAISSLNRAALSDVHSGSDT